VLNGVKLQQVTVKHWMISESHQSAEHIAFARTTSTDVRAAFAFRGLSFVTETVTVPTAAMSVVSTASILIKISFILFLIFTFLFNFV